MYTRTKIRYLTAVWNTGVNAIAPGDYPIELMSSYKINGSGGNYVFHSKCLPLATISPYASPTAQHTIKTNGMHPELQTSWSFLSAVPDVPPDLPLNREKFPTTSDFNILMFLKEFKETLDVFRLKFWQETSYGSLTWGVLPFVGEIQAVMESLANLQVLSEFKSFWPYEDSLSHLVEFNNGYTLVEGLISYHLSGKLDFSTVPMILQIYDILGFHPDISTVWDLLPLSFLADAFLPIGDLIDDLVDEGWVTSVGFTGWSSRRFNGIWNSTGSSLGLKSGVGFPVQVYERNYLVNAIGEVHHPDELLQSELPKYKDIFNFLYISKALTSNFALSRLNVKGRKNFMKSVDSVMNIVGGTYLANDVLALLDT